MTTTTALAELAEDKEVQRILGDVEGNIKQFRGETLKNIEITYEDVVNTFIEKAKTVVTDLSVDWKSISDSLKSLFGWGRESFFVDVRDRIKHLRIHVHQLQTSLTKDANPDTHLWSILKAITSLLNEISPELYADKTLEATIEFAAQYKIHEKSLYGNIRAIPQHLTKMYAEHSKITYSVHDIMYVFAEKLHELSQLKTGPIPTKKFEDIEIILHCAKKLLRELKKKFNIWLEFIAGYREEPVEDAKMLEELHQLRKQYQVAAQSTAGVAAQWKAATKALAAIEVTEAQTNTATDEAAKQKYH